MKQIYSRASYFHPEDLQPGTYFTFQNRLAWCLIVQQNGFWRAYHKFDSQRDDYGDHGGWHQTWKQHSFETMPEAIAYAQAYWTWQIDWHFAFKFLWEVRWQLSQEERFAIKDDFDSRYFFGKKRSR